MIILVKFEINLKIYGEITRYSENCALINFSIY